MSSSTFKTNPVRLAELLDGCHRGQLQLPDFQRSWVWDEDRIKSLIASISRAFPVGALMTLECGGPVTFKARPVEGAPAAAKEAAPRALVLDGQQRLTSMYQVSVRGQVVETVTPKNKKVERWFYIDIRKALDSTVDREDAIVGMPKDRVLRSDIGRVVELDLSTPEKEYAALMFPVSSVFDWDRWQEGFSRHWQVVDQATINVFYSFKNDVLENFKTYHVPVIALDRDTSKEAVCVVFEKVNTGGKALDAFELVTAMYAAHGHELRRDWYGTEGYKGRHRRFVDTMRPGDAEHGILAKVGNTDFLHAVSLFYTRERRREAERFGKTGNDLPAVTGARTALLELPLAGYLEYQEQVEAGFVRAAKFLHRLHIYRVADLPYQSQVIPLAAVLADLGEAAEHVTNRAKLVRWFWCGVFGELYGSAIDTRVAKDFVEVTEWLKGGPEPTTVSETIFRADRLKTMRARLSAAYKGLNVLLMQAGARDLRSGQGFDHTVFFGENVDIHHIFPKDWAKKNGYASAVYDSIINKTPLSFRTNRIIGGHAPSKYLAKLEKGDANAPGVAAPQLDELLRSHLIDPDLARSDRFEAFLADRQRQLLKLIGDAMGKAVYAGPEVEEGVDVDEDDEGGEVGGDT